jgi:hypothetical protein
MALKAQSHVDFDPCIGSLPSMGCLSVVYIVQLHGYTDLHFLRFPIFWVGRG